VLAVLGFWRELGGLIKSCGAGGVSRADRRSGFPALVCRGGRVAPVCRCRSRFH
jgi:hypothetical protein